jgi:hypothetical protein
VTEQAARPAASVVAVQDSVAAKVSVTDRPATGAPESASVRVADRVTGSSR